MFSLFTSYIFGTSSQPNQVEEANVRLTSVTSDDDWVLVDRCSESSSDTDSDSAESLDDYDEINSKCRQEQSRLTRSSSTSSLPCTSMEESWFITPPPCFISTGPVHMETSPMENLLIEHPSMSVYQHTQSPALLGHRISVPIEFDLLSDSSSLEEDFEDVYEQEIRRVEAEAEALIARQMRLPHHHRMDLVRQEEKQWFRTKRAQKVQLHKSYKLLTRKYLESANKARDATHNRRQRRSNHFHGTNRSYVNNNRKC